MDITRENLEILFTGLKLQFRAAVARTETFYESFTTPITSRTSVELYKWLADMPQLRKWVGDRIIKNVATEGFAVANEKFESTIGIDRDDVEDDQVGIYSSMAVDLGQKAKRHPDKLAAAVLNANTALGYDNVPLFSASHPVGTGTRSNYDSGGSGPRWYLFDDTAALQMLLHQKRTELELVEQVDPSHPTVFNFDKYVMGLRVRYAVAPGFWQSAYASNQTLSPANFESAYEAYGSITDKDGEPFGFLPRVLMVPMSLRAEALEIATAERDAAGATNINKGSVRVIVNPWLSNS